MVVAPEQRRAGIGRELLKAAEDFARAQGGEVRAIHWRGYYSAARPFPPVHAASPWCVWLRAPLTSDARGASTGDVPALPLR